MNCLPGLVFFGCMLLVRCHNSCSMESVEFCKVPPPPPPTKPPPPLPTSPPIERPDICQNLYSSENLTDPFIIQRIQRDLVHKILSEYRALQGSPLLYAMKTILEEMADSNSFSFTNYAMSQAIWAMSMLVVPSVTYNLCDFAAAINYNVNFAQKGNRKDYSLAADHIANIVHYSCPSLIFSALERIPCAKRPDPQYPACTCPENGLVYRAQEAWDHYGSLLPHTLHTIFWRLYNSDVFVERANALFMTFAMMPVHADFFVNQPPPLVFETVSICAYAQTTPQGCCNYVRERLTNNCVVHIAAADQFAASQKV